MESVLPREKRPRIEYNGFKVYSSTTNSELADDHEMLRFEDKPSELKFLPGLPKTDTATESASKQADAGMLTFKEEQSQLQLLPGIVDHVTEDLIISKLPWRTLNIFASVSRPWNQAFQSRLDARLRALATETEVVIEVSLNRLHSLADGFVYRLPPIPNVRAGHDSSGLPKGCECVFMDGRVYCLGGEQLQSNGRAFFVRREVYVIDVAAGKRQWQQCTSMQSARRWNHWYLQYGVFGVRGKIYVCGDQDDFGGRVELIEVYDPESNTWDRIKMDPRLSPWEMVPGLREAEIASLKISPGLRHRCIEAVFLM